MKRGGERERERGDEKVGVEFMEGRGRQKDGGESEGEGRRKDRRITCGFLESSNKSQVQGKTRPSRAIIKQKCCFLLGFVT